MSELVLVGADEVVPLADGTTARYVNLDYAASTPASTGVLKAVERFAPYYSSVHRGAGFKSLVSTEVYEAAREAVRDFFVAPRSHSVVFTRNTTESLNLLAAALPAGSSVVTFASEHHANLLSWQRLGISVRILPIPCDESAALDLARGALESGRADLLAVSGASNVTGELWPLDALARLAHEHGAEIVVDAAQLAPHVPIDMTGSGIDYLAASAHKMYAPFGTGVLIGTGHWLDRAEPLLRGGGAVRFVTTDEVQWADLPDRDEAGSPNVVGAYAFAVALGELSDYGMARVQEHDASLGAYARERLAGVSGVTVHRLWPETAPRTAVAAFSVAGYHHSLVAAYLSAEHGIGIRHGCFCAHPLVARLLGMSDSDVSNVADTLRATGQTPSVGTLRASMGIGSSETDVDLLVDALWRLVKQGPSASYDLDAASGEYLLRDDRRPRPDLGLQLRTSRRSGESS